MTTNVPPVAFTPTGFVAPPQSAVLAGEQADINAAFGGDLDFTTSTGSPTNPTPQGQLAASNTAAIGQANDSFAFVSSMMDPAYSMGRWQDGIARIYFLTRIPAAPTVLEVICGGANGVPIPAGVGGATIQDENNNIYTCITAGNIPFSGTITLQFAANIPGPLAVPSSISIYVAIPQWDTVAVASGVVGNSTETRAAFETRRQQSVAINSQGMVASIQGNVLAVPGVLDAYAIENTLGTTATIGTGNAAYTLAAHSILVSATGGLSSAVAMAIFQKKAPGCAYNGNTTVSVQDPNPVYGGAGPTYSTKFEIPPSLPILFAVTFSASSSIPSNVAVLVQQALLNAFAGGDGGPRARIAGTILAIRFVAPIVALGAWAASNLLSLTLGSANTATASFTGVIAGNALTTSAPTGTIAIGQTVTDSTGNVAPGTTILSGSGSSWVVSVSQTVASEAMFGVLSNQNSVTVGIAQVPTLAAADIVVTT
jgi:hypothetical protein